MALCAEKACTRVIPQFCVCLCLCVCVCPLHEYMCGRRCLIFVSKWVKFFNATIYQRKSLLSHALAHTHTHTNTRAPFNEMLAAIEFCSRSWLWVFISCDLVLCMFFEEGGGVASLLFITLCCNWVGTPVPSLLSVLVCVAFVPLAAVRSMLFNYLMCHSLLWNRFHALVAVTLPGNHHISQFRQSGL